MSEDTSTYLGTIVTTLVTALGSCVATIAGLARYLEKQYKTDLSALQSEMVAMRQHVEDCEQKHLETSLKLAHLEGKYGLTDNPPTV